MVSPLKWHGGKYFLASRIVAMFPPHVHYVEPYAGSLAVLLAKDPEGVSEVANDANGELINFWRVLQEPETFEPLRVRLEKTPCSPLEFDRAMEMLEHPPADPVIRAWGFFVRVRQSLAARQKAFTPLAKTRTRRGMNELPSAWYGAIEKFPEVHARLRRVVIFGEDALDVIRREDGSQTLYYCDPPYLHQTRSTINEYGEHEMTPEQHEQLLGVLGAIKGKFILSGYPSEMYDAAAAAHGWSRREIAIANSAAGGKEKRIMRETLWANFPLPEVAATEAGEGE